MFYFCLVNEHKVKEQIASFPVFSSLRKIYVLLKLGVSEWAREPRASGWGRGGGGAPVYNRQ